MSIRRKLFIMSILTIITVSLVYYFNLTRIVDLVFNGPEENFLKKIEKHKEFIILDDAIEKLIFEFENKIHKDKKELIDEKYLKKMESEIKSDVVGFDIRRNNKIIWKSNLQEYDYDILEYPEFGSSYILGSKNHRELKNKENIMVVKQIDFYFDNGDIGIIYLFIKVDIASRVKTNMAFGAIFTSLFLIIILGVLNSVYIYKAISVPLTKLTNGVKKMKKLNYDFKLNINQKDEIGIVANYVEELRTELLESQKVREKYERNRKEFIDNITHDINTPITSASMNIDAILDGVISDKEKEKRYLRNIKKKIKVISKLVDELSLISDMELNEGLELTKVNIDDFFYDIINEFKYEKRYDNVEFVYSNESSNYEYDIDIQKILRVVLNIVENSIKYSNKENIKIYIETKILENRLYISIEDNGPGIKGLHSKIFERFYREDKSRSDEINGCGLGLSIVKQIIELHNGKISASYAEKYKTGLRLNIIL